MSNPNLAEFGVNNLVTNTIAGLQRDIRELKSAPQPVGAESLLIGTIPTNGSISAGPVTVTPHSSTRIGVAFIPASNVLTLWNFYSTIYIDGHDINHVYPLGASLSTNTINNQTISQLWDYLFSNDASGVRQYYVLIRNDDSINHTYYIDLKAYLPKLSGSSYA